MLASSCQSKKSLTLLDFGFLAANVYHSKNDQLGKKPIVISRLDKLEHVIASNMCAWIHYVDPSVALNPKNGFYAEFLLKIYDGRIQHCMIAIRGTDDHKASNIWQDVKTWGWNALDDDDKNTKQPSYITQVKVFASRCRDLISMLDKNKLLASKVTMNITGHSLGGALANLVVADNLKTRPTYLTSFMKAMPNVISFNAPGIGNMQGITATKLYQSYVKSIRSKYDVISKIGKSYGDVIDVDVLSAKPEMHLTESFALGADALEQHSMTNLLNAIMSEGLASKRFFQLKPEAEE